MSNGLDLVKITLAKFFESLKSFVLDEDKQSQAKIAFKILDLDRDGLLNILNLLHLYKNIPTNTQLGMEIFKVIQEFLTKNLYSKSILHRVEINAEVYLKILNQRTCIV